MLFQRRSIMGIAPEEEMAASSGPPITVKPGRRRGMFGRLGGWLASRDWERIGATMRDDPSFLREVNDARMAQAERARQEAEAEAERRTMKGRNEQLRGFIDTLPEDQRSMAWIAPGEFVRNRIESMAGPEFGDLERIEGRLGQRNMRSGEYEWAPQVPQGGAGTIQYRPIAPEEAQAYGLPHGGAGYVMGSNGRPMRTGVPNTMSADQRVRVEIGIEPALEAVQLLDNIETNGGQAQARRSPRNQQWGASMVDMVDGQGTGAVARNWGGPEFQRYTSASSAFETAMLPILSGAAVTPTEAQRLIRSALPQLGDGPQLLADKSRRRQQMVNGAAVLSGRPAPYPEVGVPQWASEYQRAQSSVGGEETDAGVPPGVDPQDWEYMTPEERALWQQ